MKINTIIQFAVCIIFFTPFLSYSQSDKVQLPELGKEIVRMRDIDQKMRVKWAGQIKKGKDKTNKFKELTRKLIALDRQHTARMREIVATHGWPTYELVGEGPSNSAWLLVQHADRNPLFQAKCLPLLKAAVDRGQANPANYAYLYDRVQVARGEKQLYATQSSSNNGLKEGAFYPIDEEHFVQQRREEMNVSRNVEEYARSMGFEYKIPSREEASQKASKEMANAQKHLSAAKEAMKNQNYQEAGDEYIKLTQYHGNVSTIDFMEAARALSLAQHDKIAAGFSLLMKALVRGWDDWESIKTNPDFKNLRNSSESRWEDFLITAEEMQLDR